MVGRDHLICGESMLVAGLAGLSALADIPQEGVVAPFVAEGAQTALTFLFGGYVGISWVSALGVVLYALGLLLPDIDSHKSMLGRYVHIPVDHRTWTHVIYPVVAFAALGVLFRPVTWLALGYLAHLWCDSLSRQGVCWFYPIPGYVGAGDAKAKAGHWCKLYRTGGISEAVVTACICAACAAVVAASVAHWVGA